MKKLGPPWSVVHTVESPFPIVLWNGVSIIDERCRCGEFRSAHEDTVAFGHGAAPRSKCMKFTWASSVEAHEGKRLDHLR